jgi:chaperonin cofactor prefoldin
MVEEMSKPTDISISSSSKLKSSYQNLLQEAQTLFPKLDQRLLLDILRFESTYADWEGSVMLKVVYPTGKTDLESKKESIYKKYQRIPSIEEDRTLRFKAIHMYLEELEKLLKEDPQIEYITGSATMTPSDAYST